MKMDQEMLDAINASTPDGPPVLSGSFTLGSDFDWFFQNDKFMMNRMDVEDLEKFQKQFEASKPAIIEQLVKSHVEIEEQRKNGTLEDFSFGDSYRKPAHSAKPAIDVRKLVESL